LAYPDWRFKVAQANRMTAKVPVPTTRYQAYWLWVMCLIGLDYFSTLGYQPSIAFQAAGRLAPLATVVVVLVTLLAALPVYWHLSAWSPNGQGSIGMLERLVHGWKGKTLILILMGFAGTNFVFTRTFSAADAAVHLVQNPNRHWQTILESMSAAGAGARPMMDHPVWQKLVDLWDKQMVATVVLLVLGFFFWAVFRHGFTRQVIQLSVVVVGVYLILNIVVIGSGLNYLATHLDLLQNWYADVWAGRWQLADDGSRAAPSWWMMAGVCLLLFPKMALGLSGFEMSMIVMPLVKGDSMDIPTNPAGRIRNTRKLMLTATLIMSAYLLSSSLVTSVLIPPSAFATDGLAADRALAYVAHGGALVNGDGADQINPLFGQHFGTLYDISTVVILCLAGAAVTICLRDLIPPYLQRLGMELQWAKAIGVILYVFNIVKVAVTIMFRANVNAQRGAYSTSVLILMASASVAGVIDRYRAGNMRTLSGRGPWPYFLIAGLFLATAIDIMIARPEGFQIPLWSIVVIVIVSMVSRAIRTTELRFQGFQFVDEQSRFLWESMEYLEFPVLVPHRPGRRSLEIKEQEIRRRHRLTPDVPIVFIESVLGDPSEFYQLPLMEVMQEEGRFTIRISRCTSIAHAIAAVALELSKVGKPPEIHFGWSDENPVVANLNFVLFGQGNVPWMVRELIRKAECRPEKQPRIVIG
jgi:hypothetical protein